MYMGESSIEAPRVVDETAARAETSDKEYLTWHAL